MKPLSSTSTGATNSAIWMLLPIAMPIVRSSLFFRAIAIADPLSAAPPTIAEEHDADEHLGHAERLARALGRADEDFAHPGRQRRRATRLPIALPRLHCDSWSSCSSAAVTLWK